jgi:predicted Zn-dependent protease
MDVSESHRYWLFALVLTAFCGASAASAQIAGGMSPDVRAILGNSSVDGPYREASPRPEANVSTKHGTVSADILRHPLSGKARKMLAKAYETMEAGNHQAAIGQLLGILAKYPESAVFVHSLLGVEYLRTEQYRAAADSLEQAVAMLPRDAVTHYNYGLSLACAGDTQRGEQEVRRALELDPNNAGSRQLFAVLRQLDGSAR